MDQITLNVIRIGKNSVSEERIFNVAQMLSIRAKGDNCGFEYPIRSKADSIELESFTVTESFEDVQTLVEAAASIGAPVLAALTATGAQAITVTGRVTNVDGVTTQATGNRTLNLTIQDTTPVGAILIVRSKTAGTETTIFGTGIDGPTITGEAGKTFSQMFVYNGTTFTPAGTAVKID